MIYLDYSATTPVNKEVLESFSKTSIDFPGNPNSLHKLGIKSNELIKKATKQISDILNIKEEEIIYTSGSSESNNLAIKGIALKYQNRGKHIITTPFEHASTYGPIGYLQTLGFEVDFTESNIDGTINLEKLKEQIREDTILMTINAVNSEIGILEPLDEIAEIVKTNHKCFFHVDLTQAIGKINVSLKNIDLASFSAHKFYGLKGIGCLYKKEKITIEPLIHGGKSTTAFRSGTPALPLIVSISKALRLSYEELDKKYKHIEQLNQFLKKELIKYEKVKINSTSKCLPHILNISVIDVKPETFLHALEEYDVYISTQTACSGKKEISASVLELTKDEKRAKSSLRISLSHLTTIEELEQFLVIFEKCYKQLVKVGINNEDN